MALWKYVGTGIQIMIVMFIGKIKLHVLHHNVFLNLSQYYISLILIF